MYTVQYTKLPPKLRQKIKYYVHYILLINLNEKTEANFIKLKVTILISQRG
jgi:hypothetical protein